VSTINAKKHQRWAPGRMLTEIREHQPSMQAKVDVELPDPLGGPVSIHDLQVYCDLHG
jgi:hypothetical protein